MPDKLMHIRTCRFPSLPRACWHDQPSASAYLIHVNANIDIGAYCVKSVHFPYVCSQAPCRHESLAPISCLLMLTLTLAPIV